MDDLILCKLRSASPYLFSLSVLLLSLINEVFGRFIRKEGLLFCYIPRASCHFVPQSFLSILVFLHPYLFSFLVISYSVWSSRTQIGHFLSYLYFHGKLFWSFRTQIFHFRTQVISYPSHELKYLCDHLLGKNCGLG